MPNQTTGVYPVFKNKFKIGAAAGSVQTIAEMSSFSVTIDGQVQEWTAMEDEGWTKRLVTGKSLTISLSGKRCIGDTGNDFVFDKALKTGTDCNAYFEWEMPSGAKLTMNCVVSVTNPGGGESIDVAPLEFDIMSNGKPDYTSAA